MIIRKVLESDYGELKPLLEQSLSSPSISDLSTYPTMDAITKFWLHPSTISYVAILDDQIVGALTIKENHPELGAHIAHASYLIAPEHLFKGYEFIMCVFSLNLARNLGFLSIQFDLIIKPEQHELPKWEELGFSVIGELENRSQLSRHKDIRTFIMAKKL